MDNEEKLITYFVFGFDIIDKEIKVYKVALNSKENIEVLGIKICYDNFVEYEGFLKEEKASTEVFDYIMSKIFSKHKTEVSS